MGVKELLASLNEKQKQRKELLHQADQQMQIKRTLQERQKSANERELERFHNEDREELIKRALEVKRREREEDIRLNHNPVDVENITSHSEFEVLKEKNQFANVPNTFADQGSVLKNDPNLLRNNGRVLSNDGSVLKNTASVLGNDSNMFKNNRKLFGI